MQYADTNYIYIILAVLYVIYSIVQAGKKASKGKPPVTNRQPPPVQQHETAKPKEEKDDEFKKVLEELFGEIPKVEVPQKQEPAPKPRPVESKPAPAKIIPKRPKKETLVSKTQPEKANEAVKPQGQFIQHPEVVQMAFAKELVEEEEVPAIDFDMRQAVIHSEILQRPNW